MGYENVHAKMRIISFYLFQINPKTDMCPKIHRIQSDDSPHIPDDSHDLHQNSIIPIFYTR